MGSLVVAILAYIRTFVVTRHKLALEAVALRQQLVVLKRKQPRPRLKRRDRVQSNYSCGTCIIPEQASETLPAFNAIARAPSLSRLGEQHEVSLPLVRALGMEVRKILVESAPQRTLTEQNEPGKTLFLYRAHPTFRERVQIGRARWKSQWFHSSVLQEIGIVHRASHRGHAECSAGPAGLRLRH